MRLDDGAMYPEDENTLRWGHTEILPDDRNGRLVLSHDRSNFKLNEMNHPSVVRLLMYFAEGVMSVLDMMMPTLTLPCLYSDSLYLVYYSLGSRE